MQEAFMGPWARQSGLSTELLGPLHDLNVRFLDLIASYPAGRRGDAADPFPEAPRRVAPMSAAQRAAAARCPYSLFDLRFDDEVHWRVRLQGTAPWRVADADEPRPAAPACDSETFVRLALFYAWHVAYTSRHAARVLLGMSEGTAAEFRAATLARLPPLVGSEALNLTARFCNSSVYWSALAAAAARTDAQQLRKVQLFGLQLAAASRLP